MSSISIGMILPNGKNVMSVASSILAYTLAKWLMTFEVHELTYGGHGQNTKRYNNYHSSHLNRGQ